MSASDPDDPRLHPSSEHAEVSGWLGAYVLGGLSIGDRARVDAHLLACDECIRACDALLDVPDALAAGAPPVPPRRVGTMPSSARPMRWRLAAAGVALAACAAGVGFALGAATSGGGAPPQAAAVRDVPLGGAPGQVTGTAELASRPWGTEVRLTLRDLPPRERVTLVAENRDGRKEVAAVWVSPENGKASVTGATGIKAQDIVRISILDARQQDLTQLHA
ncbi:zf-HC2 domain-containing protein [Streptomyces sp. NPDC002164]|uniref:zf-HC2 domain-containing protein n=1 Tax=Streptomyces sp. NPDC002164 TaxID=3364633 RepID=UPI0036C03976